MMDLRRNVIRIVVIAIIVIIGLFHSSDPQQDILYEGKKVWKLTSAKHTKRSIRCWEVNLGKERVLDIKKMWVTMDYVGNLFSPVSMSVYGPEEGRELSNYIYNPSDHRQAKGTITVSVSPELIIQNKQNCNFYFGVNEDHIKIKKVRVLLDKKSQEIVKNSHDIEGYTSHISYYPGETVDVKVHSPFSQFNMDVFRYGNEIKKVYSRKKIPGIRQNYLRDAYRSGANWQTACSFQIPHKWRSGLYASRFYDRSGKESFATFLVKDKKQHTKKIAIIASTNTWDAYNTWGGASLYRYYIDDQLSPPSAQIVNTQRPNRDANPTDAPRHLASAERLVLGWLEKNGYEYSLFADADLHRDPHILENFNTVILNTHAEYWTENMSDGLISFLNHGGNLAFLSGNGIYGKAVIKGNYLEVRKLFSPSILDGEPGGLWRDLGRPESAILGSKYTTAGYATFAPYKVLEPNHWIFSGTGLQKGDLIGQGGFNRNRLGASGHETDKTDLHTPEHCVVVARGTNPASSGAEMLYYDHRGGGGVFSVGSIAFGNSLVVDAKLDKIVKNVLSHFLKK